MLNAIITPKYKFKKCLKIIFKIFDNSEIQYCNSKICSLWGLENIKFPYSLKNYFKVI